jgi:hypothetical protein
MAKNLLSTADFVTTLQQLEDRGRDNPTEMTERLLVTPITYAKTEVEKKSSSEAPILVAIDALGMFPAFSRLCVCCFV